MRWVVLIMFGCSVWASPIHKTIDQLLESDDTPGISIPEYDPFKRAAPLLDKKSTKKTKAYRPLPAQLTAVLNEKAFINGHWYKKGDLLAEGKVIEVRADSVYLKKGKKIKILRLKKTKSMFTLGQKDNK